MTREAPANQNTFAHTSARWFSCSLPKMETRRSFPFRVEAACTGRLPQKLEKPRSGALRATVQTHVQERNRAEQVKSADSKVHGVAPAAQRQPPLCLSSILQLPGAAEHPTYLTMASGAQIPPPAHEKTTHAVQSERRGDAHLMVWLPACMCLTAPEHAQKQRLRPDDGGRGIEVSTRDGSHNHPYAGAYTHVRM